jgi:uncharacterized protein YbjT (DUF2867 family)
MSKTAIVIGATGLVGQALVEQLAAAPHIDKVISVTRRPVACTSPKITNEVVDFDHLERYASVFRGDYLFSCLGTTRRQAGSIAAQRRVDLDYQYAAAELAARNGVPHYLLVSSSHADANSRHAYVRMKGELEQKALALPFQRVSILQPSLLLGNREQLRVAETVASWIMPALCRLPALRRHRPIRGDEVAAKLVELSREPGPAVEFFRLDGVFPRQSARARFDVC